MATSVKMDEETKDRLELLQAEIKQQTGKQVTQQALLARLVDTAYESRDDVVDSFRDKTVPLSEDERAAMQQGRFHSGTETTEEDIDKILYG